MGINKCNMGRPKCVDSGESILAKQLSASDDRKILLKLSVCYHCIGNCSECRCGPNQWDNYCMVRYSTAEKVAALTAALKELGVDMVEKKLFDAMTREASKYKILYDALLTVCAEQGFVPRAPQPNPSQDGHGCDDCEFHFTCPSEQLEPCGDFRLKQQQAEQGGDANWCLKHNAQTVADLIREKENRKSLDDDVLSGINPGDYALTVRRILEKDIAALRARLAEVEKERDDASAMLARCANDCPRCAEVIRGIAQEQGGDGDRCAYCGKKATKADLVGIPLCQDCYDELTDATAYPMDYVERIRARLEKAEKSLLMMGATDNGGELWKPPLGKAPDFDTIDGLRANLEQYRKALELIASCEKIVDGDVVDVARKALAGYECKGVLVQIKPACIQEFISLVRDSFVGAEHVYMNGSCYYFAKMLQTVFGGELWETHSHVYLRLNGGYYDIRGRVALSEYDALVPAKEPTLHGKYDLLQRR